MNIFYFYLLLLVHPYLAMWWKSFEQADRKAWEALVPGYNYFIAFKLGSQKPWWSLLLIFPGVHIAMWSVANVSYIRRFGYFSLVDTLQGVFFPYVIMYKIASSGDKILPETNWANSKEVGDREWGDHLALFLSLPIIGHAIALGFAAVTRAKPGKKTKVKEWGDSIWFALIAALIIRTYVFEPFKIPTGSMEKTLLVGDFLFVNKLAYGPKVPVTPFSYPLVHNTVPFANIKSYLGIETSNYVRLPGFGDVERNDVVVFNYPAGDTAVYDPRMPNGLMGHNYHDVVNKEALYMWLQTHKRHDEFQRKAYNTMDSNGEVITQSKLQSRTLRLVYENVNGSDFLENHEKWTAKAREVIASGITHSGSELISHKGIIYRPVDKRENYIKRCVGIHGDWLELKNSILYVNDKKAHVAQEQNLKYEVKNFYPEPVSVLSSKYGLDIDEYTQYDYFQRDKYGTGIGPIVAIHVNRKTYKKLKSIYANKEINKTKEDALKTRINLVSVPQYSDSPDAVPTVADSLFNLNIFPNDININNTVTDLRRFQIPSKGQTIKINKDNIPYYRRIITAYEGHTLVEKSDGTFIIDGKKATTYTFSMNYYWMMGDNRFNSADSRMWGFVPEDHIVGKASMVWLSSDPNGGFRWDRMFTVIK
jgi:signal peptidase I